MWHDFLTDREVREIVLHALVVLMSMVAFLSTILLGIFYMFTSAYAWFHHMRAERKYVSDKT